MYAICWFNVFIFSRHMFGLNEVICCLSCVVRTHMQDLKDITNNVHYENFRYSRLAFLASDDTHQVIEK